MAEETKPAEPVVPVDDPFDLGDTGYFPTKPASADTPAVQTAPTAEAARATLPDRNADGTFKKSDYLVNQALDLGYSQTEIDSLSSEALGASIRSTVRERLAYRQQQGAARDLDNATIRQPATPEPEEDLEAFDPIIVKRLRAAEAAEKRVANLEARLAKQEDRELQRQAGQVESALDDAFAALGERYEKLLGKGPAAALDKTSAELRRRIAILKDAGIDFQALPTTPQLKAKLKASAEAFYPAPVEPNAYETNGKSRVSPAEWAEAGLARPTQRAGAPEPKGDALATQNMEKKLKERGQLSNDAEIEDTLLD